MGKTRYQDPAEAEAARKKSIKDRNARYRSDPAKKETAKQCNVRWRAQLKLEVLQAYGGEAPQCHCCRESRLPFLTVEHLNDDGADHRREMNSAAYFADGSGGRSGGGVLFYQALRRAGFPKERGLAVACYNCNCGRRANNGLCPHQEEVS